MILKCLLFPDHPKSLHCVGICSQAHRGKQDGEALWLRRGCEHPTLGRVPLVWRVHQNTLCRRNCWGLLSDAHIERCVVVLCKHWTDDGRDEEITSMVFQHGVLDGGVFRFLVTKHVFSHYAYEMVYSDFFRVCLKDCIVKRCWSILTFWTGRLQRHKYDPEMTIESW